MQVRVLSDGARTNAADADFEVVGTLGVKAMISVPDLRAALALAEQHRPDLIADRSAIAQSAAVHLEQRRAKPQNPIRRHAL